MSCRYASLCLLIAVFFLFPAEACSKSKSEGVAAPTIQQPVVAGAFYPANAAELKKEVDGFLSRAQKKSFDGDIFGVISPHAGYQYSGVIAGAAFRQIEGRQFSRVVVMAGSHRVPRIAIIITVMDDSWNRHARAATTTGWASLAGAVLAVHRPVVLGLERELADLRAALGTTQPHVADVVHLPLLVRHPVSFGWLRRWPHSSSPRVTVVSPTIKSFDNSRYTIRLGRIAQGDDFATHLLYQDYMNSAINGNHGAILLNAPLLENPLSTWGIVGYVNPVDEWYLTAGVYGADTRLSDPSYHGTYMGFDFNQGAFIIAQTGYLLNRGENDRGLQGSYNIGGYYCTGSKQIYNQPDGTMHQGIPGGYLTFDQEVFRFNGDKNRSIKLWAYGVIGPENISLMPYSAAIGIVIKGFTEKRLNDQIVFGAVWGKVSPLLALQQRNAGQPPQDYEIVLEFAYWLQATKFFYFEPDIQAIVNPGGTGKIPNALVLGFQSGVNF